MGSQYLDLPTPNLKVGWVNYSSNNRSSNNPDEREKEITQQEKQSRGKSWMVKQIINLPLQSESKLTDDVDLHVAMRHKLNDSEMFNYHDS